MDGYHPPVGGRDNVWIEYYLRKYSEPKGTKGIYISPKSTKEYAPEMEFILDRHTKFQILDIDYWTNNVLIKIHLD